MRKGQVENFFTDIIPGVILTFIAYFFLSYVHLTIDSQNLENLKVCDAFGREILLLLQAPAPERPGLTYADWVGTLFPLSSDTEQQQFVTSFTKYTSSLRLSGADLGKLSLRYPFLHGPLAFDVRFSSKEQAFSLTPSSFEPSSSCKPFFIPHLPEPLQVELSWKPIILVYGQEVRS